ncbi:MAG: hypothetical protein JO235_15575 [Chroococcidiopsidaceae cyanobacterium CP_BM_RX_35]|nr:hypothetical protein [Chroococcidiopsidaceae cyanobacterium CP_BM_RX_35]
MSAQTMPTQAIFTVIQAQKSLEQQILWKELEDAANIPEEADLPFLCQMLDQAMTLVPEHLRLAVAGEAFVQLANIYASRSSTILDAWERSYNSLGPVLTAEGLVDLLVRQSLHVNLDDLIQVPEYKYVRSGESSQSAAGDSIVGHVDKDALLKALEHQQSECEVDDEAAKARALDVAHNEDVSAWVNAIAHWMQQHSRSRTVSLVELQQELGIPMVEVWLGLLLGEFGLEQSNKDFYCLEGIWIQISDSKSEAILSQKLHRQVKETF